MNSEATAEGTGDKAPKRKNSGNATTSEDTPKANKRGKQKDAPEAVKSSSDALKSPDDGKNEAVLESLIAAARVPRVPLFDQETPEGFF